MVLVREKSSEDNTQENVLGDGNVVTEDCFETMSCEQSVKKTWGPAMYMYRGNNISGRGTKKFETLEVGTDLVMFQKQKENQCGWSSEMASVGRMSGGQEWAKLDHVESLGHGRQFG